MSSEEQHHVALPKLYGAPAYARPPRPVVATTPRPFDPDDLPLEACMTPEERALKEAALSRTAVAGGAWSGGDATPSEAPARSSAEVLSRSEGASAPLLRPRPFRLRALAARLLGAEERAETVAEREAGSSRER